MLDTIPIGLTETSTNLIVITILFHLFKTQQSNQEVQLILDLRTLSVQAILILKVILFSHLDSS